MQEFIENKKVIITGHTGFKGSWLCAWLLRLGAKVTGVSLGEVTDPSHYSVIKIKEDITDIRLDIRNNHEITKIIKYERPDYLFHLAAQPLVREAYRDPLSTYETNIMGTVNVLDGLRLLKHKCAAVLVTSDKCYDNLEWAWGYRETDKLGGKDPYSASKGAAELVIQSYFKSYFELEPFVRLGIARAGNVIGGGDWASNRIIPDCAASWAKKKTVQLRNPNATRPWQHVLEPLGGYLRLATELYEREELQGEPFNFGPPSNETYSVLELVKEMGNYWSEVKYDFIKENNAELYESGLLKLNCDKALQYLNWKSVMSFRETVRLTADWYRTYYERKEDMRDITFGQIEKYQQYLT